LEFLKLLKGKLPSDKTLSIAAPASYWYLQNFPIANISQVVDYIVFMTYDLHGQWDYGNAYSDTGCPDGNCLRSHVNLTETLNSLSMITKAGVPSSQIVVGVASYGRSFQMTDPGCTGPMCTYTGPDSGAQLAPCTQTAGYIANAEINALITVNNSGVQTFHDSDSESDIVIYANDQWVAYMNDSTKQSRIDLYQSFNFGGTSNWAVDLERLYEATNSTTPDPDLQGYGAIDPKIEFCTTDQTKVLQEAWRDASELAEMQ
jgi:GH18 family chitinase